MRLPAAAEELDADGAYFRVHHFARQLNSPFPLLAATSAPPGTGRPLAVPGPSESPPEFRYLPAGVGAFACSIVGNRGGDTTRR
jgi:hypothetical protein